MNITFMDERLCCWGSGAQGGSYLLRLTVRRPLMVCFGRFNGGEPVIVPPGDYLYVGSALAQKGASSLARRLLRHASWHDSQNPHAIQKHLLRLLPQIGLGPEPLHPPLGKKLRWHVDYLLDEAGVDLTAVYLIRSPKEGFATVARRGMETAVARWLLTRSEVAPLVAGLGATDDPGGTHLLRVTAVPAWWQTFPQQLTRFLRRVAL